MPKKAQLRPSKIFHPASRTELHNVNTVSHTEVSVKEPLSAGLEPCQANEEETLIRCSTLSGPRWRHVLQNKASLVFTCCKLLSLSYSITYYFLSNRQAGGNV